MNAMMLLKWPRGAMVDPLLVVRMMSCPESFFAVGISRRKTVQYYSDAGRIEVYSKRAVYVDLAMVFRYADGMKSDPVLSSFLERHFFVIPGGLVSLKSGEYVRYNGTFFFGKRVFQTDFVGLDREDMTFSVYRQNAGLVFRRTERAEVFVCGESPATNLFLSGFPSGAKINICDTWTGDFWLPTEESLVWAEVLFPKSGLNAVRLGLYVNTSILPEV